MHAAMHAAGVTYRYPGADALALDDVDVVVQPGEYVALLGPNGAGKTTLINMVTGLRVPDSGTVRVTGGDPTRARTRLGIGVVLQDSAFPKHLSVRELVEGAAVRAGVPRSAASAVIAEVGLTAYSGRRSGKLSGGQRRRLQLARALVTNPSLVVLDEPTEGLDAAARQDFWHNLAARRDAGMAVLLTTHLIEEAGSVADRVTVIAGGRVVADEAPARLADRLVDRTVSIRTSVSLDVIGAVEGVIRASRTAAGGEPGGDVGDRTVVVTRAPEAVVRRILLDDPEARDLRVEGARLEEAVMAVSQPPTTSAPTTNASTTRTPDRIVA